jgi:hypothetical protein
MELKLQCNCGTKFSFAFEPVNGRVPFAVCCPNCKADATEFANAYVAQQIGSFAIPAAEPAPAAPATEPGKPKLRIGTLASSHAAPAPQAEVAPAAVAPPPPRPAPAMPISTAYTKVSEPDEGLTPQFFYGVAGAILGAAIGCLIWYLVFHFSGKNTRLLALLVGAGGGFGARILSKDEGSTQLGIITTLIVFAGIVYTAFAIGKEMVHDEVDGGGIVKSLYKEQVKYAKQAVKDIPNGSDDEIRAFIAKGDSDSSDKRDPKSVTAHEIRVFKEVQFPHFKELADGKISQNDYPKTLARWGFEEEVANAKHALEMMPHESDKEIREYLANESAEGEKPDPSAVTADDIAQFKQFTLPNYKKLASGEKQFKEDPDLQDAPGKGLAKLEEDKSGAMNILYFFAGWGSIFGVGTMFVTLGLAFKTSTHGG